MMKGTHPCPQLSHLTPNEKARTTEKNKWEKTLAHGYVVPDW